MSVRLTQVLAWLDPPAEWVIEKAPHRDAADWALQGPALPILVLTLTYLGLRVLDRLGVIRFNGARLRSGLRGAAVAINALFQPHARDPQVGKSVPIQVDRQGDPPPPPSMQSDRDDDLPDDGLRR